MCKSVGNFIQMSKNIDTHLSNEQKHRCSFDKWEHVTSIKQNRKHISSTLRLFNQKFCSTFGPAVNHFLQIHFAHRNNSQQQKALLLTSIDALLTQDNNQQLHTNI